MKAPDKIYLHGYSFSDEPVKSWEREPKVKRGVTGFKPQYAEYIRKDALLEWAKEHQEGERQGSYTWSCYQIFIDKLNSM